jgi:CubicO group peptidase (beta-lactamase class C family)
MRTLLSLALVLGLVAPACGRTADATPDPRFSKVREMIARQIEGGVVPSIVVAVAEDGEIIWEEGFGWSDVENRVPATPHTMYRLGSISKTIAATGLMILVEEGRVKLDEPALEYLPKGVRLRAFEGEEEDVTVRHLLNNRSGMPAYAECFFEDDPGGLRPFDETVRRYGIVTYPPGESYVYCNLGYQLIGRIVAHVSGMSYDEFIEKKVLAPLGMTESQVYVGSPLRHPYAFCYTQGMKKIPQYLRSHPGAEDNYASARDLIRFAMFHLGDNLPDQEAILSDRSINSMQEKYPPSNNRYGLGWSLDGDERGFRSVYHGGEGPGVDNMMRLFPEEDIAAVVLCNADCEELYDIQKAIFEAMIPELAEPEPVDTSAAEQESEGPDEMYGTWRGRVVTYDRELEVQLEVDSLGVKVIVADQPQDDVEVWVLAPSFLLGRFDARLPTPDNERYPYRNRLAVVREGDRLYGAVTTVSQRVDRAGENELSSRVELRRSRQD